MADIQALIPPTLLIGVERPEGADGNEEDIKPRFFLNPDAKTLLDSISVPLSIICIAGSYRTGKSFISNCIAGPNSSSQKFVVGNTIQACTKGIWMRSVDPSTIDLEKYPHLKGTHILLLDTEGLGSIEADSSYDAQLFALSLLLSSFFIFNSVGAIDESQLDRLGLVVETTRFLETQASAASSSSAPASASHLRSYFPSFLWLLRDFVLDLHTVSGNSITEKQYLELTLQQTKVDPSKKNAEILNAKNAIREAIQDFFTDRDCFTLVRPVDDESNLVKLDTLSPQEFRPQFLEKLELFKDKVWAKLSAKKMNGHKVTGPVWIDLVSRYTEAVNQEGQAVINISSAWDAVVLKQCSKATQIAKDVFAEHLNSKSIPILEEIALESVYNDAVDKAIHLFKSMAVGDSVFSQIDALRTEFAQIYAEKREKNRNRSLEHCTSVFEKISSSSAAAVSLDSIDDLAEHLRTQVIEKYNAEAVGPSKHEVLSRSVPKLSIEMASKVLQNVMEKMKQRSENEMKEAEDRRRNDLEAQQLISRNFEQQLASEMVLREGVERESKRMESEVNYFKDEMRYLKDEKSSLQQRIDALESDISHWKTQVDNLQSKLSKANEEMKKLYEEIKTKESEKTVLEGELQTAKGHLAQLELKCSSQAEDIESTKRDLKAFSGSAGELQVRLAEQSKEMEEIRAESLKQVQSREERAKALEVKLSDAEKWRQNAEKQQQELESKMADLQKDIDQAKASYEKLEKRRSEELEREEKKRTEELEKAERKRLEDLERAEKRRTDELAEAEVQKQEAVKQAVADAVKNAQTQLESTFRNDLSEGKFEIQRLQRQLEAMPSATREGLLRKQKDKRGMFGGNSAKKERWCSLQGNVLSYYTDSNKTKQKGSLALTSKTLLSNIKDGSGKADDSAYFDYVGSNETGKVELYKIFASSRAELELWHDAISRNIRRVTMEEELQVLKAAAASAAPKQ